MIVLRNKEFSFKDRMKVIGGGIVGGASLGMVFALPIATIAKVSGGKFRNAFLITTLGGAILGGLLGASIYNSEAKLKAYEDWKKKNWDKIKKIVEKNMPPKPDLQRISKFYEEAENLSELEYESNGYFLRVGSDLETLTNAMASVLYVIFKDSEIPPRYTCPVPVLSIGSMDDEEQQVLHYDKKVGYITYGNKPTTPRKFVLEAIDKFNLWFEIEDEDQFIEYKKRFIEIVNKRLW